MVVQTDFFAQQCRKASFHGLDADNKLGRSYTHRPLS